MSILINNKVVEIFNFPGGECNVRINPSDITNATEILANLNSSNDVMCLLLSVDAVRRVEPHTKISLIVPYLPYARQDRVCNEGESLSIKVMTDIINNLKCECVTIYDPHSEVAPALINNCRAIKLEEIISNSVLSNEIFEKNITLVSPDAGAEKKVLSVSRAISTHKRTIDVVYASKVRDTFTGEITSTQIHGEVGNKNFMILDDICDGGRTFIELAKELKVNGAKEVYLYVTHGIFSKGLSVLKEHINHVYCLHTLLTSEKVDSSFLTVIGIN